MFIKRSSGEVNGTEIAVINTVKRIQSKKLIAAARRTPSVSPAPNRCDTRTENPAVSPLTNPKIKKEMGPVSPTPVSAAALMVLPTITVSTILYNC